MNLNEGKPPLDERATSPESQHERPHPIITLFGRRVEVIYEGISNHDGTGFMEVRQI